MQYEDLHGTLQSGVFDPVQRIPANKPKLRRKAYLSYAWRNKKPNLLAPAGAPRQISWRDSVGRIETPHYLPTLSPELKKTYHRPWTAELMSPAEKDAEIRRLKQKICVMKAKPLKPNIWSSPSVRRNAELTKHMTSNNVLGPFRAHNHSPIRPFTGKCHAVQLHPFVLVASALSASSRHMQVRAPACKVEGQVETSLGGS